MAKPGPKRAFRDIERRRKLILTVREHPDWTHQELADHLCVDRSTITRDLNEITRDLQRMNTESFQVHWQRLQMEIQANKMECMERLRKLTDPNKGSRWMEELTKLMQLEIKLLGLDKFDPALGAERSQFDKRERDAVIDAAMKGYEMGKSLGSGAAERLIPKAKECDLPENEIDETDPLEKIRNQGTDPGAPMGNA